jgi:ABC-2 type transport system permease protein
VSTQDPKPGVEAPNTKQGEPARGPRVDVWALLGSALMAVILVLVNVISYRRYERWDITEERLFTLSERTVSVLAGLDRDVDVYVFMAQGEPTYQDLRELLTRYGAHSQRVHAEYVDPDREPTKFRVLAEKYGVRVGLQENGQSEAELAVLVVSGDKRWSITRDDLVDVDLDSLESGSPEGAKVNVKTEQALSGAIVQVTSGRATTVCITEGHGEWTLEGGGERTLVGLRDELKRENVVLESLATRGKSALPKTCDAVFVLGPQKAYSDEESAALKGYLEQGGSVLLALDPVIRGEELVPTGLEGLAESYGVHVDPDVMVELDPEQLLSQSPVEHVLVTHFTDHRLVRPVAALGAPLVSALSRSLSLPAGSKAEALFKSSDKAYGEVKLSELTAGDDMKPSEGDVTGPLVLGAVVDTLAEAGDAQAAPKKTGGRLVVLGDSDFVAPELLGQPQLANVDLVASITGYLTEREALVSIAPRKAKAQAVLMSADDLFDVFLRVVVLMPLAVLVLGVGVYLQRQK